MWVYRSEPQACPAPAAVQNVPAEKPDALTPETPKMQQQAAAPKAPKQPPALKMQPQKDCWLLAGAFLLGSASAGILRAFCEQDPQDWMQFYLQSWQSLFTVTDAHAAAALFGVEYLTLAASATMLLLLGFSALGPVLIFLFSMLYGLGNGTLFAQIFSGLSLQKEALLFLLVPLPAAVAAAGLCLLGASALQVSARIRAYSFFPSAAVRTTAGPAVLVRNYLLTLMLFLPLCGVSAALTGIGSRL